MAVKIAILGDSHIPGRAARLPAKLLRAVRDFGPDRVFFTGDFTSLSVLKEMQAITHTDAVRGERDFLELPEHVLIELEGVKFGIIHGNQVYPPGDVGQLENLARFFEVDVLVSGHSHQVMVSKGSAVLMNPGSCTGIALPGEQAYNPSAILLNVDGGELSAKIVEIAAGSGKVMERAVALAVGNVRTS